MLKEKEVKLKPATARLSNKLNEDKRVKNAKRDRKNVSDWSD